MKYVTRLQKILDWAKGPDVLNVGCTDFDVNKDVKYWQHGALEKKFHTVVGIDISQENIELMQRKGYQNLYIQDAESFELNRQFDTIVAGELIEHLSNPGLFLKQALKHLKPNGFLIITTPYPFGIESFLSAFRRYPVTCRTDEHTCWFCLSTLRGLLNRCGFKEIHVELIPQYYYGSCSLKHDLFIWFITRLGFLIPYRLRNNSMFFVFTPQKDLVEQA